ncbi:hypothetical protein F5Y14DRAFT_445979 [Nemania sp. NC0429]|nr:hypothetical protein F5Y14DRAFT_445979 [Nemania sp. NC0429]
MLSVSSLLNPAPPGPPNKDRFPPSPTSSSTAGSCAEDSELPDRSAIPRHKMPKDAAVFTKSKPNGAINFHPYEDLDELSLQKVRKFQVYPLGKIREYSRHIPYNSGKKDFFEKTGRESFEVFQYVFRVPGDDLEYTVMWDYNVGLVRMTPFFKCCKYPKTTPAKMLNSNPGLKEITHSITGGSIMAQGYWMPYQCARAVCATFCHNVSGALIPIFGPDFPSLCTQVDAPEYSRMVIDQAIVLRSTQEAEYYRHLYSTAASSTNGHGNISPKRDRRVFRSPYDDTSRHHPRYRIRKTYATASRSGNGPYTTDTDDEMSPITITGGSALARDAPPQLPRFPHSPIPSMIAPLRHNHIRSSSNSVWAPANTPHASPHSRQHSEYQAYGASPWPSATSRFTATAHPQASSPDPTIHPSSQRQSQSQSLFYSNPRIFYSPSSAHVRQPNSSDTSHEVTYHFSQAKRPAVHIEDGTSPDTHHREMVLRQAHRAPPPHHTNNETRSDARSTYEREVGRESNASNVGADKNAAMLLISLSVQESSFRKSSRDRRDVEAASDTSGPHEGVNSGHIGHNNGGGDNVFRYQAGAGAAARNIKGGGVSSETTSPFDRGFPRIKRVRSNSM